ncbi:MAG: endonuclease III [Clostridia bacterium]|nr:endonuclease III [Clostridia bacterium]
MDAKIIFERLNKLIPDPKSELEFNNEFELLIAVMLSAQCTDKRVNIITSELFKKYKTPMDFASLSQDELLRYISSCNYCNNKAKNIISACKAIGERFGGKVPKSHEDLISLDGVGHKTANVVQAVAYGQQAFPVDTHILRVSNRLGIVATKNPNECERVLKEVFSGFDYAKMHHLLLLFGRYYCTARTPQCDGCVLKEFCKKE